MQVLAARGPLWNALAGEPLNRTSLKQDIDRGLFNFQDQLYKFRLHEDRDYGWQPRLSVRDFISVLANLTAIKIRAVYSPQGKNSQLTHFT